jgi:hypothetical protein
MGDIFRGLGCLALIGILIFGAMASWFTSNPEKVGAWAEKATGIKEAACKEQWLEMDDFWSKLNNRPANSGPVPHEIEEEFRLKEEQLAARCGPRP